MQIIYCMMAQNRLSEVKKCVERALPYVDHIVVVDGGSVDDSLFYFRNWSQQEPKLHFYLHPWTDHFSDQRNNYLLRAKEFAKPGDYILVSDPDELFEEETFKKIREIAQHVEKTGHNAAGFQCRSVSLKGEEKVWESLDNYWKHLLYKWEPELKYHGNPHEGVSTKGGGLRVMNTEFIYEHIKQENIIWHRGMRNFVIGGGGPNLGNSNAVWVEFKEICREAGIPTEWHSYERYILKGNVDQRLKDWMIRNHDIDGFDGCSEIRECYKTYFRIFHPEEEPAELRDKPLP